MGRATPKLGGGLSTLGALGEALNSRGGSHESKHSTEIEAVVVCEGAIEDNNLCLN